MSDNEFESGASGALNTQLTDAGRLKPGSLVMLKGDFPCKVTAFSTAKPGKHGSAKAMISGKDIFTDKVYEETFGTGDMVPAPVVTKTESNCLSYDDEGALQVLDPATGDLLEHLNIPTEPHLSDVAARIKQIIDDAKKECLITVQKWGDREQVVGVREGNDL